MVKKYKFDWTETKNKIKQEETAKAKSFGDDRFWKLDINKETKLGSAIIRFVPDEDGTLFKKYFSHWFTFVDNKDKKRWYTEKCATTIGGDCPVCEKNKELFDSPYDSDKDVGRERKRKIHYVANIEIVKDPAHEENEGKIKLFDFGPQVHGFYKLALFGKEETDAEKAQREKMGVDLPEQDVFVPADFEAGRNFFYRSVMDEDKSKGKRKWNTYLESAFQKESNIRPGLEGKEWDQAIADVMEQTILLSEFVDPQSFPPEIKVQTILTDILGQVLSAPLEKGAELSQNRVAELNDGPDVDISEDPELETLNAPTETDQDFIDALQLKE